MLLWCRRRFFCLVAGVSAGIVLGYSVRGDCPAVCLFIHNNRAAAAALLCVAAAFACGAAC